ncbi:MAG: ribosome assembly RNA-binding protein YhbY [Proteobacteria bacterium]|nr:MAG: ribosome assembly RNA-binding protein YhbY [Pseudomonadota bacterium]
MLTGPQKRFLRARAQALEPMVWIGDAGLTGGVRRALDEALAAHELVKVRMRAPDDKRALAAELAATSGAALVHLIGHTAVLYRPDPDESKLALPRRDQA